MLIMYMQFGTLPLVMPMMDKARKGYIPGASFKAKCCLKMCIIRSDINSCKIQNPR